MKFTITVVNPSGEYRSKAPDSPTKTLSAPYFPSSPAAACRPEPPSATACTSVPAASASLRAAVTTSCATLRSSPSRDSANAKIPGI